MIKKLLFITLVIALLIAPISAETITIRVDTKHIEGYGTGRTPITDTYCSPMYLISERQLGHYSDYIVQEYPIHYKDYYRIKIGQTVTLESPESDTEVCKVVSIQ